MAWALCLGRYWAGFLGEFGTRAPFIAAAILAGANMVFGYFVLPETVTDAIRRPIEKSRLNPFGAFKALSRLDGVARGIVVYFLMQMSFFVYPAVWSYFGTAQFNWDSGMIGASLALYGFSSAIVQGFLIRYILGALRERGTALFGFAFNILCFLVIATVSSGSVVLFFIPLAAFGAVANPAIQGMLSKRVQDNEQGALQGIFMSASALASIISPPLMTSIFFAFSNDTAPVFFPGAPFIASAVLVMVGILVFLAPQSRAMQAK